MKTYAMTVHYSSEVPDHSPQTDGANSSFRFFSTEGERTVICNTSVPPLSWAVSLMEGYE